MSRNISVLMALAVALGAVGTIGAANPNEPAGFTFITDRNFDSKPQDWSSGETGCPWTIVQDATAPMSPSNVCQMKYPAGRTGGISPQGWAAKNISSLNYTKVYHHFWFKLSDNFYSHPAGTKLFYLKDVAGAHLFYLLNGSGTGPLPFIIRLQGQADSRYYFPPSGGYIINRNQWYDVEVEYQLNTPGVADGVIRAWFNGVLTYNYTDVEVLAAGEQAKLTEIDLQPIWGGSGYTTPYDFYLWVDHCYASGAANVPPTAANDSYSMYSNMTLSVTAPGVLSNDTGVNLTALKQTNPSHGSVTWNGGNDGSFSYTPTTGYVGADSFTYKAHNTYGDSSVATVSLTVSAQAPTANADSGYSTSMNQQLVVSAPGLLSNDTDPQSFTLTAIKVANPTHGGVTVNSNGSFTYTPSTGYVGADSFTYKANNGYVDSSAATVSITVTTGAPTAADDSYSWYVNKTLSISSALGVLANDSGSGLTAIKVADPSHGSVTLNSDGSFSYTPVANYSGGDSFTYKAHNTYGDSNTATVGLTIAQPARILIDCGTSYYSPDNAAGTDGRWWNNIPTNGGATFVASCTNSVGQTTAIRCDLTSLLGTRLGTGPNQTVNGWPATAVRDCAANTGTGTGKLKFSNLDTSGNTTYDLTVFGSANGTGVVTYSVVASSTTSQQIDCGNNQTTRWGTFTDLVPDANGEIRIDVKKISGTYGPLNIADLAIISKGGGFGGMSMMAGQDGQQMQLAQAAGEATAPAAKQAAAINVNFQPAGAAAPEGYLADSGLAFADRGNGQSYGWAKDLSAFAVQKNSSSSPDARYDTAIMLLKDATWEVAVPNGMYSVKIVAGGDAATIKSQKFTVEGVPTTQATAGQYFDQTVTVVVTDGKLTITGQAGSSICFMQIAGQ